MKKFILTLIFLFALSVNGWCATYYAVNAGGNWSSGTTWSTVSAKDASRIGNGATPTDSDTCYLDDYSGNVTMDTAGNVAILDCTGYTGTFAMSNRILYAHGSVTLPNGVGSSVTSSGGGITFHATGSLTSNGKTIFALAVDTALITVTIVDNLLVTNGITLSAGTLKTDGATDNSGLTHSCSFFRNSGTGTKVLTLGNSTINCSKGGDSLAWDLGSGSNQTLTCGTSTINITGTISRWVGGGKTYNIVNFTGAQNRLYSADTFATLSKTGTVAKTDFLELRANITVTGTLNIDGNSASNRILIYSDTLGTARTITLGASATFATNSTNIDIRDITMSGGAANERDISAITGGSGDCGGNSGITFTTADDWYWNGSGTRNFSDYTYWYTETNGGGSQMASTRCPLPQDTFYFNADSIDGSTTLTIDIPRTGTIDATNASSNLSVTGYAGLNIYGSLIIPISGKFSNAGTTFIGRSGAYTLNVPVMTTGDTISLMVSTIGGSLTLQADLVIGASGKSSRGLYVQYGTFDANDYNLTIAKFISSYSTARKILMGSGTWSITGTTSNTIWDISTTTNLDISAGFAETSTIVYSTSTDADRTFGGGGLTYNNFTINTGGTGTLTVTGSNTFNTFTIAAPRTVKFSSGTTDTTQTVNSLVISGTDGVNLQATTADDPAHISDANGGTNENDYLFVSDIIADQTNTFYYGANGSADAESTNWLATAGGETPTPQSKIELIGAYIGVGIGR